MIAQTNVTVTRVRVSACASRFRAATAASKSVGMTSASQTDRRHSKRSRLSALLTSIKDADCNPVVVIMRCVSNGEVVSSPKRLRPPKGVAFFFPVSGLFVATQYEIPFKLSISTFHVSVMASTPAIAIHNLRHPSLPSNFSAFMTSPTWT